MSTDRAVRPGPPCIDPDVAPGGIVFHVYAVPTGRLLLRDTVTDLDEAGPAAERAAEDAMLELRADEQALCLVAYDGDTGQRYNAGAML